MRLTKQDKKIIDENLKYWMWKEYIETLFNNSKRRLILEYIKKILANNMNGIKWGTRT